MLILETYSEGLEQKIPQQEKLDSSRKQPIEIELDPSRGPDTAYQKGKQNM